MIRALVMILLITGRICTESFFGLKRFVSDSMWRTYDLFGFRVPLTPLREARLQAVIAGRLSRLAFSDHPALRWSLKTEGYKDLSFGARAGPGAGFSNLCHEIAHAVEFGADQFRTRVVSGHFVFKLPRQIILGHSVCEPETPQVTLRECRVGGIQKRLLRAAGYRIDDETFIDQYLETMSYMPDACCLHGARGEALMRKTLEKSYRAWTMDRINKEMQRWLDKSKKRLDRQRKLDRI